MSYVNLRWKHSTLTDIQTSIENAIGINGSKCRCAHFGCLIDVCSKHIHRFPIGSTHIIHSTNGRKFIFHLAENKSDYSGALGEKCTNFHSNNLWMSTFIGVENPKFISKLSPKTTLNLMRAHKRTHCLNQRKSPQWCSRCPQTN